MIGPRQLRFGERGRNNARVKDRKIVQRYLKSSTLLSKFCDYTCVTCVDAASLASLAPQHSSTQSAKLSNHTLSHCHIHHDSSSLAWPRQLGDIPLVPPQIGYSHRHRRPRGPCPENAFTSVLSATLLAE